MQSFTFICVYSIFFKVCQEINCILKTILLFGICTGEGSEMCDRFKRKSRAISLTMDIIRLMMLIVIEGAWKEFTFSTFPLLQNAVQRR